VGKYKTELNFGAHCFNVLNTSVGSHSCSLENGIPPSFMHLASGVGGTDSVEIQLRVLGPWGEQIKERNI